MSADRPYRMSRSNDDFAKFLSHFHGVTVITEAEQAEKAAKAVENAKAAVPAQAAEVRAAGLAAVEALMLQRAAFLALVSAKRDLQYGMCVSSSVQDALEEDVRRARADWAVAQAREELAKAKLKALQLATEMVVHASD